MPRRGTIPWDVAEYLRTKRNGASMEEIREAVAARRGGVLPHSVRSAIYSHLDDAGDRLFERLGSGRRSRRYRLRG